MAARVGLLAGNRRAVRRTARRTRHPAALPAAHSARDGSGDLAHPRPGAPPGLARRDPPARQSRDPRVRAQPAGGAMASTDVTTGVVLSGLRAWRHDLAGCLHACAASLLASRGLAPLETQADR